VSQEKELSVKHLLRRIWKEDQGFLTFEWILLVTLLTIGIIGGIAAVRDAIIDELGDVAQAMLTVDQSFRVDPPLAITVVHAQSTSGSAGFSFKDSLQFADCSRYCIPISCQPPRVIDDGDVSMP